MFIITSVAQQGEYANQTRYFAIDRPEGVPYWAHWINRAEIFASEVEATTTMNKELNVARCVFSDGSTYPNVTVLGALSLYDGIMRGTATICVQEITLTQKTVMMVSDYIAK